MNLAFYHLKMCTISFSLLCTAPSVPRSATKPSQNSSERTMYQRDFLLQFKERCKDVPPELENIKDVFKLNAHQ